MTETVSKFVYFSHANKAAAELHFDPLSHFCRAHHFTQHLTSWTSNNCPFQFANGIWISFAGLTVRTHACTHACTQTHTHTHTLCSDYMQAKTLQK